jgi:hypothetical protein
MLRPVVAKRRAIDVRLSPRTTVYERKVGIGVGVGRTNDGKGVGPLGDGLGVGEPAGPGLREPLGPTASGRQALATTASSANRTTARRPIAAGGEWRWRMSVTRPV